MHKPRLLILFFILFLSNNLSAQKNETVYDKPGTKISGILAPSFSVVNMNNDVEITLGGRLGLLIAQRLVTGGYAQVNPSSFSQTNQPRSNKYQLVEGGIWLGYFFVPHKIIHPSLHLMLGYTNLWQVGDYTDVQPGNFFIVEPRFEFSLAATNILKISAGVGYRHAIEMDESSVFTGSDFSGPSVSLNLNFGYFD